jgi:hypothetical protein
VLEFTSDTSRFVFCVVLFVKLFVLLPLRREGEERDKWTTIEEEKDPFHGVSAKHTQKQDL